MEQAAYAGGDLRRFGAFESEIKGQIGKKKKKIVTKVEKQ